MGEIGEPDLGALPLPEFSHGTTRTTVSQENPRKRFRRWPLCVIALGAIVAVWSGWVGLGELTGFGVVQPLPGIWDGLKLNTSVVLPLSVEAYGAYALGCWLGSASLSGRTRAFARRSVLYSLSVGLIAQAVYHLLAAAGVHAAPWPVTMLVAIVPVVVLGLASTLTWMITTDYEHRDLPAQTPPDPIMQQPVEQFQRTPVPHQTQSPISRPSRSRGSSKKPRVAGKKPRELERAIALARPVVAAGQGWTKVRNKGVSEYYSKKAIEAVKAEQAVNVVPEQTSNGHYPVGAASD